MRAAISRSMRLGVALTLIAALLLGVAATAYYLGLPSGPSTPPTTASSEGTAPVLGYKVINTFPHDTNAFTEGLVFYNGSLYESTGLNGNSSLRHVDLQTGRVLQIYALPSQYFGEGIAIVGNRIIQLTYQTHIGFVYDLTTFKVLGNFTYPDEGWGLTYNGSQLIMSDGSSSLYFLNPQTFQRTGEITVHDGSTQINNLNELEYINGSVFANVWLTNRIAVINPTTGQVRAWIDLTGIENLTGCHCDLANDVLNGIAYDNANNRLYVTGKMWPDLFQIEIVPPLSQVAALG